jgi:hypothetical protein
MTPLDPEVRDLLETLLEGLDLPAIDVHTATMDEAYRQADRLSEIRAVLRGVLKDGDPGWHAQYLRDRLAEVERSPAPATESTAGERKP